MQGPAQCAHLLARKQALQAASNATGLLQLPPPAGGAGELQPAQLQAPAAAAAVLAHQLQGLVRLSQGSIHEGTLVNARALGAVGVRCAGN